MVHTVRICILDPLRDYVVLGDQHYVREMLPYFYRVNPSTIYCSSLTSTVKKCSSNDEKKRTEKKHFTKAENFRTPTPTQFTVNNNILQNTQNCTNPRFLLVNKLF